MKDKSLKIIKYYDIPKTTINRIQLFKQDRQLKRIEDAK